jgi:Zn-dependent protease
MGLMGLFFKDPLMFLLLAIPLLYSIIFHEMAHGITAYFFGDDTAKRLGRLSLNPKVHLDLFGTVALFIVGFGWAKPVPVNYYNFKKFRLGLICVSLAGCLANIFIAIIAVFLLQFQNIASNPYFGTVLLVTAKINIILGAFNLIPIPPLDGSKILMGFLPEDVQQSFARFEPYGFIVLIVLLFTGFLNPIVFSLQKIIIAFISAILGIFI